MSKRNPLFLVSRNILRKRFRFYSTRSKNEFDEAIKKWGSMPRYLVEFNERYKRPYGIPGWVHILLIVAPFFIVLPLYQTYLITNQRKYGHPDLIEYQEYRKMRKQQKKQQQQSVENH